MPKSFSGGGDEDFRFNAVLVEEAARRGLAALSLAVTMQNDIALPCYTELANPEQQARWLPGIVIGELIGEASMGFRYMSYNLAQERLWIAISAVTSARERSNECSPT